MFKLKPSKKHINNAVHSFLKGVDKLLSFPPLSEVEKPTRLRAVFTLPPQVIAASRLGRKAVGDLADLEGAITKKFERMAEGMKESDGRDAAFTHKGAGMWLLEYNGDADEVHDIERSVKGKLAARALRPLGVKCYIENIGVSTK